MHQSIFRIFNVSLLLILLLFPQVATSIDIRGNYFGETLPTTYGNWVYIFQYYEWLGTYQTSYASPAAVVPSKGPDDGISFGSLAAGSTGTLTYTINTGPYTGIEYFYVWADWNNDGYWDTEELIVDLDISVSAGSTITDTVSFTIPAYYDNHLVGGDIWFNVVVSPNNGSADIEGIWLRGEQEAFKVDVAPVPLADAQSLETDEDMPAAITLTGSDANENPLTYSVVTNPSHGTLSGTAPHLTYTPNLNYNGSDSFTFKVNNGTVDSAPATVSITVKPVNDAPVADANGLYTADEGSPITFDASSSSDIDGDPLQYRWDFDNDGIYDTAWSSNPSASYTWNDDHSGTAKVEVSDGSLTDTDTATVTVTNVAPTVDAGADQIMDEGDVVNLAPAAFNDLGTLDTHTATIDWGDGTAMDVGVVTESPIGPPGSTAGANGTIAGSHAYGDNGIYTVTVTVIDDDGASAFDTLIVTVNNVSPTIDAGDDQEITAGDFATFNRTFSDPGWLDTHTAMRDYGDEISEPGEVTEENEPPEATGIVTGGHSYFKAGDFTVTLTVADDDGGESSGRLTVIVNSIAATIDFDPDTLNKKSGGEWVTVYIELPEGYDVWQIDGSTVLLNGIIPAYLGKEGWAKAEGNESNIMDHDGDGFKERMVKFDKIEVKEILAVGDEVQVTITGGVEYDNGYDVGLADFKGHEVIQVIDKGKGPKAAPALAKRFSFAVLSAYPQPCNPEAWLPYTLAKDVEVIITIYSSSGRIIRILNLGHQEAGAYISKNKAAYWNGKNNVGETVSSGVYFYRLKAGDFTATKKLVVLR